MGFISRKVLEDMGFRRLGKEVKISDKASIYNCKNISIGDFTRIDDFCLISAGEGGIDIGSNVHIAFSASIIGAEKVVLEDYVGISARVSVYSSTDDYKYGYLTNPTVDESFKHLTNLPVTFKKHALIGAGSVVLPGVTVGEGAAAGSLTLINKSVKPYDLVVGSPMKVIGQRSEEIMKGMESAHRRSNLNVNFCSPLLPNMDKVGRKLEKSFKKGHLSNFGPAYTELKARLKNFMFIPDDKDIVLTSSGHTALMAAHALAKHKGFKKTAVPTYTFESTRSSATGVGLLREDVPPSSPNGCFSAEDVKKSYELGCDVATVVCALSSIPNLPKIQEEAERNGMYLILDAAAAFDTPGLFRFCDALCISFHATKSLSAGEAGAIVVPVEDVEFVEAFINFGKGRDKKTICEGINGKVSDFSCAVASVVLEDKFENARGIRLRNYSRYKERLPELVADSYMSYQTVFQSVPLFFKDKKSCQEVRTSLLYSGVQVIQYYLPLEGDPVSEDLYDRNLCLPCHQDVSDWEVDVICDIIEETLKDLDNE